MRQVYEQVAQVARTNTTVLIRGESGTGKELIAHAIHYNSPRAKKPFVKVSCAALPDSADRVRAVRLREGRVHRRAGAQEGPLRAGRRRHAVPRRDRRAQPRHAGQAAARAAGARVRAPGRHRDDQGQRPPDRRHQQGPRDGDRRAARSARTSTTGSTSSRSSCRRCASASRTSCCWPTTSSRSTRASTARTIKRISTPAIDMLMSYHWPGNVRELENTHRARGARVRRPGDPRAPPAAHAADGGGVGHGDAASSLTDAVERLREGPHPGRAEERPRQPRQGGAAARYHRAHHRLQGAQVRHRRAQVPRRRSEPQRRQLAQDLLECATASNFSDQPTWAQWSASISRSTLPQRCEAAGTRPSLGPPRAERYACEGQSRGLVWARSVAPTTLQ